jgi:AraC-like DNA-binding protein
VTAGTSIVILNSEDTLFSSSRVPLTARDVTIFTPSEPASTESVKVVFVLAGRSQVVHQGGAIQVEPGHILAFPERAWCAYEPYGFVRTVTIYLRRSYLAAQLPWLPIGHPLTAHLHASIEPAARIGLLDIGEFAMSTLAPKLAALAAVSHTTSMMALALARATEIFHEIQQTAGLGRPSGPRTEVPGPAVLRAIGAIHADPSKPWTVRTLARTVALSESQLSRVFRSEIGTSPGAYLRRFRLAQMARLLATTSLSVGEVATASGWLSRSAASRAFHQRYGVPPSAYAAQRRAAGEQDRPDESSPPLSRRE